MRVGKILAIVAGLAVPAVSASGQDNGHLTIENPGEMGDKEIASVYAALAPRMQEGYALSQSSVARNYTGWTRYNRVSYLSATHGNRYVNNYANAEGARYGRLEPGGRYPEGTVFAKDSFTVTKAGKVFPGALFVMEKLAAGRSPGTADWRYVMIMPDGSLFGDSAGDSAEAVAYCHTCHEGVSGDDFVFFVPDAFRAGTE